MSTLIIPAAGKSTRFPNTRPKWMLTHPKSGNMMLIESIRGLDLTNFDMVYIGILKSHLQEYKCKSGLLQQLEEWGIADKVELVELEVETNSQPETVCHIITNKNINDSIFIKDCDGYFKAHHTGKNSICIYNLKNMKTVNAVNKSYITVDDLCYVNNIIEKKIISDMFCCGGYEFRSSLDYLEYYEKLKHMDNLYTSHIIYNMIVDDINFKTIDCEDYLDWGTEDAWLNYTSKFKTYFIDLDGVLVYNSAEFIPPFWGETTELPNNVKIINELYDSTYSTIVITTSRKESYRKITVDQLNKFGIKYHKIIFDLPHAHRVLINDYSTTNKYPSCSSINIKRNDDILMDIL